MFTPLRFLLIAILLPCFSQLSAQVITTFCGDTAGYCGDGGLYSGACFNYPSTVFFDSHSSMYIVDWANNRIRKIDKSTNELTTIVGTGTAGYNGDNIPAKTASISHPGRMFIDSIDNIYFADAGNNRVRKIDASTGIITTIAGNGTASYSGDGGPATAAALNGPEGVYVNSSGVYITDFENHVVRKVSSSGIITNFAGVGVAAFSSDEQPATTMPLHHPECITGDNSGNLYFTDMHNYTVKKIDFATGMCSNYAGNGMNGISGDGGAATSAKLMTPSGLTYHDGHLYVAQPSTGTIRDIDVSSGIINTIAGVGVVGFGGDGGPATSAKLSYPQFACVAPDQNLYIADASNNRIRKILLNPTGISKNAKSPIIEIYPNPSKGKFTISGTVNGDVAVCNIVGITVANTKIFNGQSAIDLSGQPDGVYFVNLKTDQFVNTYKVVITK